MATSPTTPEPQPDQVLARKYRPQTFSELIGQERVRSALDDAIALRRIISRFSTKQQIIIE